MERARFDVVVIGAGPAGLSAALMLGRAGKSTLVLDGGLGRNGSSHAMHGFLGHDGAAPEAFAARVRSELSVYPTVSLRAERASGFEREGADVRVLHGHGSSRARRVLLATGMIDVLPKTPGLAERWGTSVFSCPYCHGHELRDRPWGVLARSRATAGWLPTCAAWTRDLTLFLDGRQDLDTDALAPLRAAHVRIEPRRVISLSGPGRGLLAVHVEGGADVPCEALVVHPAHRQSDLVLFAGLALDGEGAIAVSADRESSMRGVFVAGDARGARAKAISAAADGAEIAVFLAESLTLEDFA